MTGKLRHKRVILIGILSLIVVALVVAFAVPALAAGWPRAGVNRNFTTVQGKIALLGSNSIEITTTSGTVTLTLDSNTKFSIQGNDWLSSTSLPTTSLVGDSVTAIYNNGQAGTTPVASQVMINMPSQPQVAPGTTQNYNFAFVQGTLAVSATSPYAITITPSTAPSVPLTAPSNPNVTIIYNSSNGAVQRIILNRSGQATTTPTNLPNNTAIVQGTLTVSATSPYAITITPSTAPSVALTAPSAVAILYNNSTGAVQQLMLGRSGQAPFTPNNLPNHRGMNWHGNGQFGSAGPSTQ